MATISPVLSGDYLYEARPKINTALSSLNVELTGLNTVVAANSATWSQSREINLIVPTGTPNSSLSSFGLPYQPAGDVVVFINGLAVAETGYSITGTNLTFTFAPLSGDSIMVFIPTYGGGGPLQLVVPTGLINSANTTFTLPYTPTGDAVVFVNGLSIQKTTDFTVSGTTLTMLSAPLSGDVLTVLLGTGGSEFNSNPPLSTLVYSSTAHLEFKQYPQRLRLVLGGNVIFTGSGYADGRTITVFLSGDTILRTTSFNYDWRFISDEPTELAANKVAVFTLECIGLSASDVRCAWVAQP